MKKRKSTFILRHQFITAFKHLTRFKNHIKFSLIGLSVGLACVFIISAWTIQELRYDRFHHQSGQIYMVTTDIKDPTGNVSAFPETPQPLAAELLSQIPQIEKAFHFLYLYGGRTLETDEHSFKEAGIAADSDFLEVLNFKLVSGNAGELDNINTIMLSQDLAGRLYPDQNPINKEITYKDDKVLVVKGIFKNCPANSSLQFDFLISYEAEFGGTTEWFQLSDATFLKLKSSSDPGQVHSLMRQIWRERIPYEQYDVGMISIADLRYEADFEFFNAEHGHGDRNRLFLFIGVAVLILILSCLNYLILAASYAMKREKEIWIRKVHGAGSGVISSYFIIESVLLSIMAWGTAALISQFGLSLFEDLLGIEISPAYFNMCIILGLALSILIVGVATGFYPALQAGSRVLVNSREGKRTGVLFQRNLRRAFVGSQFILSIALTICGIIVFRQAGFMKNFDTGYSTSNIVEFQIPRNSEGIHDTMRDWLEGHSGVASYGFANTSPVNLTVLNTRQDYHWEGLEEDSHISIFQIIADEDFLNVFDISLLKGRYFSSGDAQKDRIVINEKLANMMDMADPVGQVIHRGESEYQIIGVVEDFNFQHLSNEIRPLLFICDRTQRRLFVHYHDQDETVVEEIRDKISVRSDKPLDSSFISESRDKVYEGETQMLTAILFFTVLCVLLSSLGLIGMLSHSSEERAKETAVRKVLGADSGHILILQIQNLFRMFIPATLLGALLAWVIMSRWMENFAYRIGIEWWVFILGPAFILISSLLSTVFQIWKASRQAPVISLKYQ